MLNPILLLCLWEIRCAYMRVHQLIFMFVLERFASSQNCANGRGNDFCGEQ
jgi:hypothetical protein